TPLPQSGPPQSESVSKVQPAGQQPSPPWHIVTGAFLQRAWQVPASCRVSVVQASRSSQLVGQEPGMPEGMPRSQVSPKSTRPLPQRLQSPSEPPVQPDGQQPSPVWHMVTGAKVQAAVQVPGLVRASVVH